MTDHKTVREAFEKEWPNWDKYPSGNYMDEIVQTAWENFQAGYAAALDRIKPVETVTVEDIAMCIQDWKFNEENQQPFFGDYLAAKFPNGLRIVSDRVAAPADPSQFNLPYEG